MRSNHVGNSERKRGPASIAESEFVNDNLDTMSDKQMAVELNRTPDFVRKLRAMAPVNMSKAEQIDSIMKLHEAYYWSEIVLQLFDSEVKYFEQAWIELIKQFSQHGVLHSDEMSIKDLILHDILSNRALIKKTHALKKIDELDIKIIDCNPRHTVKLTNLQDERSTWLGSIGALTEEHLDYLKKKDDKLKALKATRESRLKGAEQSSSNFWEKLKEVNTPEMRRFWSNYAQRLHLAGQIVELEWSEPVEVVPGKLIKAFESPEGELRDQAKEEKEKEEKERLEKEAEE